MVDHDNWNIFGFRVEHCLSEIVEERCMLEFNRDLAIAVICCNSVKALCMLSAVIFFKEERLCTQWYCLAL